MRKVKEEEIEKIQKRVEYEISEAICEGLEAKDIRRAIRREINMHKTYRHKREIREKRRGKKAIGRPSKIKTYLYWIRKFEEAGDENAKQGLIDEARVKMSRMSFYRLRKVLEIEKRS